MAVATYRKLKTSEILTINIFSKSPHVIFGRISHFISSPFLAPFLKFLSFFSGCLYDLKHLILSCGLEGLEGSGERVQLFREWAKKTEKTVCCSEKRLHGADLRQEGSWTQPQAVTLRLGLSQGNNVEKVQCLSQSRN